MPSDPASAIRDALGLVRLLYAVERETDDLDRRTQLHEIGLDLQRPGPRAVAAVERLVAMGWQGDAGLLVSLAAERVRGGPRVVEDPRAPGREAKIRRGG